MTRHWTDFLCRLFLVLVLCGVGTVMAGGKRFWAVSMGGMLFPEMEVAFTPEERSRGLMERDSLPEFGGMIFLFEQEQLLSFWMRNTRIPLDVIYVDGRERIVSIRTMAVEPQRRPGESEEVYLSRLPGYSSGKPAIAAIEVQAGMASSLGLKPGDALSLRLPELRRFLAEGSRQSAEL